MADMKVKLVNREKSKENYNTNSSQLVIELEAQAPGDWAQMFNSSWQKSSLRQLAQEAKCGGNTITVTFLKDKDPDNVFAAVEQLVQQTNKEQNTFYSKIDKINERIKTQ